MPQRHCINVHRKTLGKTALKFQKQKVIHSLFGHATTADRSDTTGTKTTKNLQKHLFSISLTTSKCLPGLNNGANSTHLQKHPDSPQESPNDKRTSYSQLVHNARFIRFACRERARSVIVRDVLRKKKDGRSFSTLSSSILTARTSQVECGIASAENEKAGPGNRNRPFVRERQPYTS
ncbi:MAG: hypothetical protein HZC54_25160 [Verrucomicrobia bacterium]|nr:hypothetical protein [Verrucomicrobiota bacterium]